MRERFDMLDAGGALGGAPLLAAQLQPAPGLGGLSGEARLALAVVEDAIVTVRMTTGMQTPRARRLAIEAWSWIASQDRTHPFAFENLCDHLGIDAAWLRRGLRRAGHGRAPLASPAARYRARRRTAPAIAV